MSSSTKAAEQFPEQLQPLVESFKKAMRETEGYLNEGKLRKEYKGAVNHFKNGGHWTPEWLILRYMECVAGICKLPRSQRALIGLIGGYAGGIYDESTKNQDNNEKN